MNPGRLRTKKMTQIEINQPVSFRFDGKIFTGYVGDSLASALLANGVHMIARSFKYHRPRGIISSGSDDPAGLVQLGVNPETTTPNMRATELEIFEGLEAFSQNRWPSLRFDFGAMNDFFGRFIPAGFYYKTFMGPPGNWMFFEKFVRKASGLGVAPTGLDPDQYEHINRHCDVLVIGSGPTGLMAAYGASKSGARVVLVEEHNRFGGRLTSENPESYQINGASGPKWVDSITGELENTPEVLMLKRTCAFGYYGENWITLIENVQDHLPYEKRSAKLPNQRLWHIRTKRVILATGALERPLVFPENDRPGIMLAGAVRCFLHKYGVIPGRKAVIFTNNSSAWKTAFDLHDAGVDIAAIIDIRNMIESDLKLHAESLGIRIETSTTLISTNGRHRINSVTMGKLDCSNNLIRKMDTIPCDVLAVSGGWSPNIALYSQSGGDLTYNEKYGFYQPKNSAQEEESAGAANGVFNLHDCLKGGLNSGIKAAKLAGFPELKLDSFNCSTMFSEEYDISPVWQLPSNRLNGPAKSFVDIQNDVTAADIHLAVREGYHLVEHTKRYTTLGMGTDQGKISNINGLGILSELLTKNIPDVGVTTYRQPFKPVTFGAMAGQYVGHNFYPRRTTPMHEWHKQAGATFEIVNDWIRARAYPKKDEPAEFTVQRECLAARTDVAVLDASTLGKIDIRGPDAREFLNRVYSNSWLKLAPGRCRYGLMLNEDGMVFDDGVTACLTDSHFHMTTTTGGAATVMNWLEEYHQTEWPHLKVYLTSVTEQWAVASICGPKSTDLVSELLDDVDVDSESLPFMACREGQIDGLSVLIFHVSFTGELSYEINIAARYGLWLWQKIIDYGKKYGLTPYGTDSMHLLRAEKGFILVGQDTDGTVTPIDLNMAWAVKEDDFIGRRSLFRSDTTRDDRLQFVGLLSHDLTHVIPEGAQIISTSKIEEERTFSIGHVTSSYFSPNLGRSIALGFVRGGHKKHGDTVFTTSGDQPPRAAIISDTNFISK